MYEKNCKKKVYFILRILVVLTLIHQATIGNYYNVFLCFLTLVLFMLPTILAKRMKVTLPNTLEIIILFFIFSAEILGEINAYYLRFQNWDTILHTMNGFLMAAIGFAFVDLLNDPITINIKQVVINGQIWPNYIDIGLIDTMMDMFVNFIGAITFSIIGFFYVKAKGNGKFANRFIRKIDRDEDELSEL